MRRSAITAVAAALLSRTAAPAAAQDVPSIQWTASGGGSAGMPQGAVNFSLTYRSAPGTRGAAGRTSQASPGRAGNLAITQLEGLTPAQVAAAEAPVRFKLRRDAGTFECEGAFNAGRGSGTCGFAPSAAFAAQLEQRGVGRPTAFQQFSLALHDVGTAYLDELAAQRYARPAVAELVDAGLHGAGLEFLKGMGAAGYKLGSLPELVRLRDHAVTPEFVGQMRELGYDGLTVSQLATLAAHGVTPEFVRQANQRAGSRQPLEQLIHLRATGAM